MDIKNLIKNITPSVTVMAIGLVGAYFVYNTYFSDRVASSAVVQYEPAAGQEAVMGDATDMVSEDMGADHADTASEAVSDEKGMEDEMAMPESVEGEAVMDEAVDAAVDAAEDAAEGAAEGAMDEAGQSAEEMMQEAGEKAH